MFKNNSHLLFKVIVQKRFLLVSESLALGDIFCLPASGLEFFFFHLALALGNGVAKMGKKSERPVAPG